jgi:hypothetical protein
MFDPCHMGQTHESGSYVLESMDINIISLFLALMI